MSNDDLTKEYNDNFNAFDRAMTKVVNDLSALMIDYAADHKIRCKKTIENRIKSLDSIKEKIKRKDVANIFELRDLVGVKIIVNNLKDANTLTNLITQKWKDRKFEVEDYITSPKKSGYRSVHINLIQVVEVKGKEVSVPVEIQIKTLAQDLWSVLSHGDIYKPDGDVPEIISQFSNSLGALLDVVDNQAQFIRDFLAKKIVISKDLSFDPKDDVDKEIIAKIIHDAFGTYITEGDYRFIINYLETYNITTADILRKLVNSSDVMDSVKSVFKEFGLYEPGPADLVSFGSIVFYYFMSEGEVTIDLIKDAVKDAFELTEHECESCGKLLDKEEESYCENHVENADFVCRDCLEEYAECIRCGMKTDNENEICDNCWDNLMSDDD